MSATALDRFMAKVVKTDDCWLWFGAVSNGRYGSFNLDGRTTTAHRAVYRLMVGPIPEGLTIDHLCMVKLCVNPAHLEPATSAENTRRGRAARMRCKRGHPLSGPNLRQRGGRRQCRACERLYPCNAGKYRLRPSELAA